MVRTLGLVMLLAVSVSVQAAWTRQVTVSPMDGKQTAMFQVNGAERVRDRFGRQSVPAVVILCTQGDALVYFTAGTILGGSGRKISTRLRFDAEPAELAEGVQSTDYEAVFFDYSKRIARKLLTTKTLLVEFTPFQSATTVTRIDVSNLSLFRADLEKHCQLKSE